MNKENIIWAGKPSQMENVKMFTIYILTIWLVIPLFLLIWKYLTTKYTVYTLTNQRLTVRSGVLNKKQDELELYRIRDYRLDQPLLLRVFGLSNLFLVTSDRSDPLAVIRAVKEGDALNRTIRGLVENCREAKGVREFDTT